MFGETTIQDWISLIGPIDDQTFVQDADLCTDTDMFDSVRLRTHVLNIANAELTIETALSFEGPWTTLLTVSAAGEQVCEIECDPNATLQLKRFLRWKVTSTAATWNVCFMIAAVFQKLGERPKVFLREPGSRATASEHTSVNSGAQAGIKTTTTVSNP